MLKVSKILIDRQENPAALSEPTPYLGWQLESDRQNVHQTAYRICIRDGLMPFGTAGASQAARAPPSAMRVRR